MVRQLRMAEIRRRIERKRWYGTLDDVYRLVLLGKEVQSWPLPGGSSNDEHFRCFDAKVKQGGLGIHVDSFEELREEVEPRDIAQIENLDVRWDWPASGSGLSLEIQRGSVGALRIEVVGADRNRVAGLARRVEEEVERGTPARLPELTTGLAWVSSINALWLGIGVLALAYRVLGLEKTVSVVLGVGVAALGIAVLFTLAYLNVSLELLGPGELPRWQRSRRRLLAIFGSLILSVIGGVATALLIG